MWPKKKFDYIRMTFFEWARENNEIDSSNLIIINDFYMPDEVEFEELISFAKRGNTVFIAAQNLGPTISKAMDIDTVKISSAPDVYLTGISDEDRDRKESYWLNRYKRSFQGSIPYGSSFTLLNDSAVTVLGTGAKGRANFIKKDFGEGSIYLSGNPAFFTNYGMLHCIDQDYIFGVLSHLPEGDFIWNDFDTMGFKRFSNPLRFLRSQPPLWWAYWLSLVFALFWVLFKAKRNQRIIPIIEPIKNESLDFLKIVGRVYFRRGDHKDLADKKIRYFFDHLRSRWLVKAGLDADTATINTIAGKTGFDLDETEAMFEEMRGIQRSRNVTQKQLESLHKTISHFYKETNMYGKRKS